MTSGTPGVIARDANVAVACGAHSCVTPDASRAGVTSGAGPVACGGSIAATRHANIALTPSACRIRILRIGRRELTVAPHHDRCSPETESTYLHGPIPKYY